MPKSSSLLSLIFASITLGSVSLTATTVQAKTSWVVFDADSGRILGQDDANLQRAPASLAKMMTLYLAFEGLKTGRLRWDEPMPVSKNAAAKVKMKLGLRPGSTLSVRDAINSMIVISANDSATVMGEYLAGSEKGFGRLMTQRARKLGMKSTFFVNPSGLTAAQTQLTTARDMAVLGMALRNDFPEYYHLFSQRSTQVQGRPLNGHNNLMYRYNGVDGIKTGYTNVSGYNLVSSAIINNKRLVGVVLGAGSSRERDDQMAKLLTKFSTEGEGTGEFLVSQAEPAPVAVNIAAPVVAKAIETNEVIEDDKIEQGDGGFPVATGRSPWKIQIGVATTPATAERLKASYGPSVLKIVPGAKGEISQNARGRKRVYNVRYSGLRDEQAAANACAQLKLQKIDCLPIKN